MPIAFYFLVFTTLSVELFILGSLVGFFQKKFYVNDIFRFIIATAIATFFLGIGYIFGKFGTQYLYPYNEWYAATVLFILGLKMYYNALKLHKEKQVINPLDNKGLIFLSTLSGINAFFIGIVFSLMQLGIGYIFYGLIIFLTALLLGYIIGFKRRKLFSLRFEFITGTLYIIIAIIIVIKL